MSNSLMHYTASNIDLYTICLGFYILYLDLREFLKSTYKLSNIVKPEIVKVGTIFQMQCFLFHSLSYLRVSKTL